MRILATVLLVALAAPLTAQAPARKPSAVRAVHDQTIIPGSDALFAIEKQAPKNAAGWQAASQKARLIGQGATLLMAPERARDKGQWLVYAKALAAKGAAAVRAVEAKDAEQITLANGDVLEVCESCHVIYRDHGKSMPR